MMDLVFDSCMTYEAITAEPCDFPKKNVPVWLLGKQYRAVKDLLQLRKDVYSRLWFTYRRGFVSIGDSGQTSDKGWGCMLRCGQMVLAQALVCLHLGRDWRWTPDCRDSTYLRIVHLFEDRRAAPYSIHQIALMGASDGREVGTWFGPNTVAQVLRKLSAYDEWSQICIHIAMDNTIVRQEVKRDCLNPPSPQEGLASVTKGGQWRPLVLIVPLRLGLSEINPLYVPGLKACFSLPQCIGVIGGKPNHALYFIGYVEDEVVFLDPHTTQTAAPIENKEQESEAEADKSLHCPLSSTMPFTQLDPSVAVCFLCPTEHEFNSLCESLRSNIASPSPQALFEICEEKALQWGNTTGDQAASFTSLEPDVWDHCSDNSEEEGFELLG